MKKKIICLSLFAALGLLAGCSNSTTEPETTEAPQDKVSKFSVKDEDLKSNEAVMPDADLPAEGKTLDFEFKGTMATPDLPVYMFENGHSSYYLVFDDKKIPEAMYACPNNIFSITFTDIDVNKQADVYNKYVDDLSAAGVAGCNRITRYVQTLNDGPMEIEDFDFRLYKVQKVCVKDAFGTVLIDEVTSADQITALNPDAAKKKDKKDAEKEDAETSEETSEEPVEEETPEETQNTDGPVTDIP